MDWKIGSDVSMTRIFNEQLKRQEEETRISNMREVFADSRQNARRFSFPHFSITGFMKIKSDSTTGEVRK